MTEQISRRAALVGAAAASLLPLASGSTQAAAPLSGSQASGWYRYKVGSFEVTVATDGINRFKMANDHVLNRPLADVTNLPIFVRNPGWHLMFDQDAKMAEETRRKVYDMLVAEKMMVQGFHYPFPAVAYVEKAGSGYREIPVMWNGTL